MSDVRFINFGLKYDVNSGVTYTALLSVPIAEVNQPIGRVEC